jgi:putative transcriptional regulator
MTLHVLTDDIAMAFAAGSLPPAFSVLVAAHCDLAPEARARVASFEALGGAVLEDTATEPMGAGALAATLARVKSAPRAAPVRPERRTFPKALRDVVGGDLDSVRWKAAGGGVKQAVLMRDKQASLRLLSIPAGKVLPEHGHRGLEMTLVLKGAFSDGEQRFGRGDIEIADPSDQHVPVAEPGEDCICLAATDAPLRFVPLLARLAQPFIRI